MRVPTGAIDLALRTGAIVFPAMVRRTGRYALHAQLGPAMPLTITGDHDHDLRENLSRLVAIFERHMAADPGQWTVVERIWYEDAPSQDPVIDRTSPATPAIQ